jgi:hypothetical protein
VPQNPEQAGDIQIRPGDEPMQEVIGGWAFMLNRSGFCRVLAAGSRAETPWLRRTGLDLTDARGWAIEAAGLHDQSLASQLLGCYGHQLSYGTGDDLHDYWCHEHLADAELNGNWAKVEAVARVLWNATASPEQKRQSWSTCSSRLRAGSAVAAPLPADRWTDY